MGLEIKWTQKAAAGYSRVLKYLDENWTTREVNKFELEVKLFFNRLSEYPELLQ